MVRNYNRKSLQNLLEMSIWSFNQHVNFQSVLLVVIDSADGRTLVRAASFVLHRAKLKISEVIDVKLQQV